MGCFNDPPWKVCVWWGGGGVVADTNYLYPARWGWINNLYHGNLDFTQKNVFLYRCM